MTLDPAHEPLTKEHPTCHFCGAKFDLGYHYTCHLCEATYCYIHMTKHVRAHRAPGNQPVSPPAEAVQAPVTQILTSDPEEIELIPELHGGAPGAGRGARLRFLTG